MARDAQREVSRAVSAANADRHMRHWRLVRSRWRDVRDEWHYAAPDDPDYIRALREAAGFT
jgi:hypothetical protein